MLKTHGRRRMTSRPAELETNYRPGENDVGSLALRLEDQTTFDSVEGKVRLDPWSADGYVLLELKTAEVLILCGAQAIVAIDARTLAWRSSVGLEYEECETLIAPWHSESTEMRGAVVATDRRVWRVDEAGAIRWMWSAKTTDEERWIVAAPDISGGTVRMSLRTLRRQPPDVTIVLDATDGLLKRG